MPSTKLSKLDFVGVHDKTEGPGDPSLAGDPGFENPSIN